jgi:uncharacterized protein YbcI
MQSEETGALKLAGMSPQDGIPTTSQKQSGALLAAISNLVVRIYAEHVGRGPTRARTYFNDNVIACVLHDTLIKPERTLLGDGKHETVLRMRIALQEAMREELVSGVEQLTGRKVISFMSGNDLSPDYATEIFVLEASANGNGRQELAPVSDSA